MLTGIDHLVIAVPDLDRARRSYEALGFVVVPGGRHPVGTHNALIAFADGSYLELIAFYEPSPAHKWWEPLARGGGLVDVCCATDALGTDLAAFRAGGVGLDDPSPLSRVRPDGYTLRWRLGIPRPPQRGVAPFLIEDETPREERVPRETCHPNGVTGIGTLTLAVADVQAAGGWYAAGLAASGPRGSRADGQAVARPELGAAGVGFAIGPHRVELLAPSEPGSPLAGWLAVRGPSPWAATLRRRDPRGLGADGPGGRRADGQDGGVLDPALTEGARLGIEAAGA